ncbi:MAG: 30S ribosomal protein S24e [Methanobacteriaceae archaeon]|nr:30S ribosomal protein S24e [Methanobacteriaceae archaeon]
MEINIINKTENPVLYRTEIKFECVYQGESTPKTLDVKNKLVAMLDADKTLLVIDNVQPHFGEGKAKGYAKVYTNLESLNDIETEHVLTKNKEASSEKESEEE